MRDYNRHAGNATVQPDGARTPTLTDERSIGGAEGEGRKGLRPERLGEAVLLALTARRPHTRYAVVPQRFKNWTLPQLLAKRLLDTLIGRQIGLTDAGSSGITR